MRFYVHTPSNPTNPYPKTASFGHIRAFGSTVLSRPLLRGLALRAVGAVRSGPRLGPRRTKTGEIVRRGPFSGPRRTLPGAEGPDASPFGELAEVPSGAALYGASRIKILGVSQARFHPQQAAREEALFPEAPGPGRLVGSGHDSRPEPVRALCQPSPLPLGEGVAVIECPLPMWSFRGRPLCCHFDRGIRPSGEF